MLQGDEVKEVVVREDEDGRAAGLDSLPTGCRSHDLKNSQSRFILKNRSPPPTPNITPLPEIKWIKTFITLLVVVVVLVLLVVVVEEVAGWQTDRLADAALAALQKTVSGDYLASHLSIERLHMITLNDNLQKIKKTTTVEHEVNIYLITIEPRNS